MSENQKKVWVTGASSGIGKAVAEKFAKENWKVAISARREEFLNEMAKNQNVINIYAKSSNTQQETKVNGDLFFKPWRPSSSVNKSLKELMAVILSTS